MSPQTKGMVGHSDNLYRGDPLIMAARLKPDQLTSEEKSTALAAIEAREAGRRYRKARSVRNPGQVFPIAVCLKPSKRNNYWMRMSNGVEHGCKRWSRFLYELGEFEQDTTESKRLFTEMYANVGVWLEFVLDDKPSDVVKPNIGVDYAVPGSDKTLVHDSNGNKFDISDEELAALEERIYA